MEKLLIIILMLLLSKTIIAQGIDYNEEFVVNSTTYLSQDNSAITKLSNGGFIVCWEGRIAASYTEIYAQIFDSLGNKVGDELFVNSYTTSYQSDPAVVALEEGEFVISWESKLPWPNEYDICAQIFDSLGGKIGSEFKVNSNTNDHQVNPSVTALGNNKFIVSWDTYLYFENPVSPSTKINAQIFSKNAQKVGQEIEVSDGLDGSQSYSKIAELSNGDIVICYRDVADHYQTHFKFLINDGTELSQIFIVSDVEGESSWESSIAALRDNEFIISWRNKVGSSNKIMAQRFDSNGNKLGERIVVNSTDEYVDNPIVDSLQNGGFVIVWDGRDIDNNGRGIAGQIFDQNGVRVGNEFQINTTEKYYQVNPSVSAIGESKFSISWTSYEAGERSEDIYSKYYYSQPLQHELTDFKINFPQNDESLISINPVFKWGKVSNIRKNFPWELTYDIQISTNESFSEPIVISGIEDTTYQIDSLTPGNTYFWKVLARNYYGDSLWSTNVNGFYIEENATDIEDEEAIPQEFELYQNYPNPFNLTTTISYSIPSSSVNVNDVKQSQEITSVNNSTRNDNVRIIVYDLLGREIKTLVNKIQSAGSYQVDFNASDLPSGVYYYQLKYGEFIQTKKMVLLK